MLLNWWSYDNYLLARPVLQDIYFPVLTLGHQYAVVCQSKQGDLPIDLVWYKNGKAISPSNNPNLQLKVKVK